MIQISSGEFRVKLEEENTLIWFITDLCNLELHTNKDKFYFSGKEEGYLTGVVIDLEEVKRLEIDNYEILEEDFKYKDEDEYDLAIVDFNAVLSKIVEGEVYYCEFDTETHILVSTLVKSTGEVESTSNKLEYLLRTLNED